MTDQKYHEVEFNGVRLKLPDYTLQTMTHCLHGKTNDGLDQYFVEQAHAEVMASWISEGAATFLDIGAATGAMVLPFAIRFPEARIIAFEPYHKVRQVLIDTLSENNLASPLVVDLALSDKTGIERFTGFELDETGETPFLPEASSLSELNHPKAKNIFPVRVQTLDGFADHLTVTDNVVIKIDVEGWEAKVLEGGAKFLARTKPRLAIDIHNNPFGDGDTQADVETVLAPLSYSFNKLGHVLICQPVR